ncbi:MAG: acetolactate synthase small subunit [Firmicutes bacterium]|nr:acetolactate synthase small subunit [Bacillota bacterium]
MKREVVSIYVENKANVLSRVVSLYGRRGFNIDSLTVSATNDPSLSRITIVFEGDTLSLNQIVAQTEKLEIVKDIKTLDVKKSFFRELLMIKVKADKTIRSEIKEVVDIYRAKIINLTKDEMVLELTGDPSKLDAFLSMLEGYEIVDICRTGITGIEK